VGRIGAGEGIDDVEVLVFEMRDDLRTQPIEVVLLERLVDLAPPDPGLRARLTDDKLVLRRPAREAARIDRERTPFRELPIPARKCMRIEQCSRRLPEDATVGVQPVTGKRGLGGDRYGVALLLAVLPGDGPG
jgi:hypothetical protein